MAQRARSGNGSYCLTVKVLRARGQGEAERRGGEKGKGTSVRSVLVPWGELQVETSSRLLAEAPTSDDGKARARPRARAIC